MLPGLAWAWGKRGHQIVGETAAMTVANEPGAGFMRARSFDFGYYANVPDFVWKRPASYAQEKSQHFMDLEIFERGFGKDSDPAAAFNLSRKEFDAKFPMIKEDAGRAFWRLREMVAQLEAVSAHLREMKADAPAKDRQALQERWLVIAGTLGHYVGDLGQPMHVTENYDGQLTGQKGLHSFFEEDLVDEIYPELLVAVNARVKSQWPEFKKKNSGKSLIALLSQLTSSSLAALKPVLQLDKKGNRDVSEKNAKRYEKIYVERMADSALVLAEIWRRNLGWKFDGNKFYFFSGEPAFIPPGDPAAAP